jgi:hypothetical protein
MNVSVEFQKDLARLHLQDANEKVLEAWLTPDQNNFQSVRARQLVAGKSAEEITEIVRQLQSYVENSPNFGGNYTVALLESAANSIFAAQHHEALVDEINSKWLSVNEAPIGYFQPRRENYQGIQEAVRQGKVRSYDEWVRYIADHESEFFWDSPPVESAAPILTAAQMHVNSEAFNDTVRGRARLTSGQALQQLYSWADQFGLIAVAGLSDRHQLQKLAEKFGTEAVKKAVLDAAVQRRDAVRRGAQEMAIDSSRILASDKEKWNTELDREAAEKKERLNKVLGRFGMDAKHRAEGIAQNYSAGRNHADTQRAREILSSIYVYQPGTTEIDWSLTEQARRDKASELSR